MAQELSRRLLARDVADGDASVDGAAALQDACTRMSNSLRAAVGHDGYNALISRALARTQDEHPSLIDVRRVTNGDVTFDGLCSGAAIHGLPAVSAGIESMFAVVVDVLSSLIGADMAANLLGDDQPRPADLSEGQAP